MYDTREYSILLASIGGKFGDPLVCPTPLHNINVMGTTPQYVIRSLFMG